MARIFIVTTGLTGILNASFEVARRLEAAGHRVTLGAPRPIGERVKAEGFPYVELPEIAIDPAPALPDGMGKWQRAWLRFYHRKARRAAALDRYRSPEFRAAVRQLDPELLLIDIELHEYIMIAYAMGRNFTLLSQWYSTWRSPGLPYLLTDVAPGEGEAGTQDAMDQHWQRVKRKRRATFAKMELLSWGADRRSTLLALAEACGFPRNLIRENWWPGVFTYAGLPAITMTPWELEFPHQVRPKLHYVGPMVYAARKEKDGVSHRGESVEVILRACEASDLQLLLATVSTLKTGDVSFLRKLTAAVAGQPRWCLVIGLGGRLTAEDLGDKLPPNVHAFAYVPQLRMLARASLSINHAGIHTIHECIHFGVPQLVYSGKRSDQPGCAARVRFHGVGLTADKDEDEVADIRRNIERVLTESRYRERTVKLRRDCQLYASERRLERVINECLQARRDD